MQRPDPDEALVVLFKLEPMLDPNKTAEEGRDVYDDVEVCEIRSPGTKAVKVFPATEISRWIQDPLTGRQYQQTYAERFSHQYRQFKASAVQTKTGTPLDYAKFLTPARRAELKAQNVYTIEALAAIDGMELKALGPYGREFKNQAMQYIEDAKASAPNKQMLAELEVLRAQNAVLQDDLVALRNARQQQDRELEEMSDEQLREYIISQTGKAPHGTLPRKSLKRMAMDASPDKVA